MNFPYFTPQIPCNYELFRIVDSRKDRFLAYTSTKSPCQRCRQHRQSHPFWWVVKNDTVLSELFLSLSAFESLNSSCDRPSIYWPLTANSVKRASLHFKILAVILTGPLMKDDP